MTRPAPLNKMKDVPPELVTWVMFGATGELEWLPDFPRPIRGEHEADVQARIAQSGWDPATVIRVVRTPDGRHYVQKRRHALLAARAANLPPDTPVLVFVIEGDPGCVELFAHNVNTEKPYTLLDFAGMALRALRGELAERFDPTCVVHGAVELPASGAERELSLKRVAECVEGSKAVLTAPGQPLHKSANCASKLFGEAGPIRAAATCSKTGAQLEAVILAAAKHEVAGVTRQPVYTNANVFYPGLWASDTPADARQDVLSRLSNAAEQQHKVVSTQVQAWYEEAMHTRGLQPFKPAQRAQRNADRDVPLAGAAVRALVRDAADEAEQLLHKALDLENSVRNKIDEARAAPAMESAAELIEEARKYAAFLWLRAEETAEAAAEAVAVASRANAAQTSCAQACEHVKHAQQAACAAASAAGRAEAMCRDAHAEASAAFCPGLEAAPRKPPPSTPVVSEPPEMASANRGLSGEDGASAAAAPASAEAQPPAAAATASGAPAGLACAAAASAGPAETAAAGAEAATAAAEMRRKLEEAKAFAAYSRREAADANTFAAGACAATDAAACIRLHRDTCVAALASIRAAEAALAALEGAMEIAHAPPTTEEAQSVAHQAAAARDSAVSARDRARVAKQAFLAAVPGVGAEYEEPPPYPYQAPSRRPTGAASRTPLAVWYHRLTTKFDCSICLETVAAGEDGSAATACLHPFHAACLNRWVSKGGVDCPNCRESLYDE